ncbi:MAG: hypothetical protein ACOVP9_02380, partial [Flavobacterium stagni]
LHTDSNWDQKRDQSRISLLWSGGNIQELPIMPFDIVYLTKLQHKQKNILHLSIHAKPIYR